MFTITIGVTADSLEAAMEAAEVAVERVQNAPNPSLDKQIGPTAAVSYAFHENDEHSTFSAQITRTPSLRLTATET